MSILAFVFAVVFGLALLFFAVAASRRSRVARKGDGDFAWLSDGGASFSDSGSGSDCGSSSDGGGSCDGGGGGD